MTGKIKIAAAAVFSAVIGLAASASHAGTTGLKPVISGQSYGGWTIIVPANVSLIQDQQSDGSLVLEKFASFSNTSSVTIAFMQTGAPSGTSSTITIENENIMNNTGQTWSGFADAVVSAGESATITSVFVPPTGPGVNYTGVSTAPTVVTYTGSQVSPSVSIWGNEGGDTTPQPELVINTTPTAQGGFFTLKEIPLTVPVPAAAWSGLTGLMGLGLLASGKKLKKILA